MEVEIPSQEELDDALEDIPPGKILVFVVDFVAFEVDGLFVIGAHPPHCGYLHVHGPQITSVLPGPEGKPIVRSEHLGECGYGRPTFFFITDPN